MFEFPGILLQQAAYPSHKSINQSIQSQFCSDCSIRVSQFSWKHEKMQLLKANPAPFYWDMISRLLYHKLC